MNERSRDSLEHFEAIWETLDNHQVIKDVAMKGKHIANAIKFIATRNETSIEETKVLFFDEVYVFINNLLSNRQVHRAIHVIKNVQLNEVYYLFSFAQVRNRKFRSNLLLSLSRFFLSERK
jgi:predicted phosphatase